MLLPFLVEGLSLVGPILFASFSSSTFSDNVVDGGFGGGIMLGGSAVVFECIIEENSAAYGAGVAMAQVFFLLFFLLSSLLFSSLLFSSLSLCLLPLFSSRQD